MINHLKIEAKWQNIWQKEKCFETDFESTKPKYYALEMFPYPSGKIHMGHLRNYSLGDVVARYKKTKGYNVLHPMGWDAFGLPAENAAIENNVHPMEWTNKNIDNMRTELKSIGLSYDWSLELNTSSSEYYKQEQEIFLSFLEYGLAYRKESIVNWDPIDQTVLANEQVIDGKGWRSGAVVEKKKLNGWFLKITDFSEDLLSSLDSLSGWPSKVRLMQEKWIGKSIGAIIKFFVDKSDNIIEVYSTTPEALFGASFCAIAADHPFAIKLAQTNKLIADFNSECSKLNTAELIEKAEKKGFDTGLKVKHPIEDRCIPLYIANFVLSEFGTGAIYGCPAHDARDKEFASKYNLEFINVINSDDKLINSSFLNGLDIKTAREEIINHLEKHNLGTKKINYRLRDWGISRQRYWGAPIPIIYCNDCGVVPVHIKDLPIELPKDVNFTGNGNPLANHSTWKNTNCPKCSKPAMRETDTFDTFFESSWYFARFASNHSKTPINKNNCQKFLPVDQYTGGIEHAVLHLLYARFFTKAMSKCGYFDISEPFTNLLTQGMITHETYKSQDGKWLYPDEVVKNNNEYIHIVTGEKVTVGRSEKMSKSKKNTIDPGKIINKYGADTARLFMLSDSPPERDLGWSDSGIDGAYKYINRLYKMLENIKHELISDIDVKDEFLINMRSNIHSTILNVSSDIEQFHFNKAIARIRELTNSLDELDLTKQDHLYIYRSGFSIIIQLLQPFIPHASEEIWENLGNKTLVINTPWPIANKSFIVENNVTIAVQVNGKLRGSFSIHKDASKDDIKLTAFAISNVKSILDKAQIVKIIIVPNKIINVVIKN